MNSKFNVLVSDLQIKSLLLTNLLYLEFTIVILII